MTENGLQRIESALSLTLPAEYRLVMASAPAACGFWYGGLFNHPERIIQDTLYLRNIIASYGRPDPQTWVVVSEINGGDIVFLDTSEPDAPLRYWNHETMEVESFTDTVRRFVESTLTAIEKSEGRR
ncbi:MAG: hypothetical protein JWL69_1518 [Phycisphaerales bacterium]|nr:hypothetical protein [Phycisphaerales bacterium]